MNGNGAGRAPWKPGIIPAKGIHKEGRSGKGDLPISPVRFKHRIKRVTME